METIDIQILRELYVLTLKKEIILLKDNDEHDDKFSSLIRGLKIKFEFFHPTHGDGIAIGRDVIQFSIGQYTSTYYNGTVGMDGREPSPLIKSSNIILIIKIMK